MTARQNVVEIVAEDFSQFNSSVSKLLNHWSGWGDLNARPPAPKVDSSVQGESPYFQHLTFQAVGANSLKLVERSGNLGISRLHFYLQRFWEARFCGPLQLTTATGGRRPGHRRRPQQRRGLAVLPLGMLADDSCEEMTEALIGSLAKLSTQRRHAALTYHGINRRVRISADRNHHSTCRRAFKDSI